MLGEDFATVGPIEEWIEAHRHLWSPNTVRGYATSLAQWWSFLDLAFSGRAQTALAAQVIRRPDVTGWRRALLPHVLEA